MAEASATHEPFRDVSRRREADRLGMLVFLASEIMLFGGVFTAAMALRLLHRVDYAAAAHHLKLWLGMANTAVLLTSSLLAALAVEAARSRRPRAAGWLLGGTVLLGAGFLGIKGMEYAAEFREGLVPGAPGAHFASAFEQMFMNLYFVSTGLHAIHVTVGIGLLAAAALNGHARRDEAGVLIGNAALYWHLVDVVWVFLYPTLYLAGAQ